MNQAASFDDDYVPPSAPMDDAPSGFQSQRADDEFRRLPQDIEAERGVLGALLLSPNSYIEISETLQPSDFYLPAHQIIYQTIMDSIADGNPADPLVVSNRLERDHQLERVGGAAYLHTLMSSVPTAANARYYAEIVAERAILRRLVEAGTNVARLGYEGAEGAEVEVVLDLAQQEVYSVTRTTSSEDYHSIEELLPEVLDELEQITNDGGLARGVPTGFAQLDDLTNGLQAGQMIIVAARPGVGKSTLALDFVRSASIRNNLTSAIFSLEMSASEIMMRLLSAESGVKLALMRSGRMEAVQWSKLVDRAREISNAPIFIDDSPNLTMMQIRAKARRLKETHNLQFVVVDYLQLMTSGKRVESRQQEVAEFSRQLKLLAKELEVPIVAISQLNRGPESRTDKKPQLADLRESGSLEQDADIVMLLYRPDSQDKDSERAGEADIIVAKHRGGRIDTITVAQQLHLSRFVDMPDFVSG